MKAVLFCHSLLSDWNHGSAHFLRGVVAELVARGHSVDIYEPREAWSVQRLVAEQGKAALAEALERYRHLCLLRYELQSLDLEAAVEGADAVLVHEWSEPQLVQALGRLRAQGGRFRLLFHDTHHRSVTSPEQMAAYDLEHYDGVLASGECLRQRYAGSGRVRRAWTWHEAADVRLFHPLPEVEPVRDLVWVGNWGDEERTAELHAYLLGPVRRRRLRARVHGVRYPPEAQRALAEAGIEYAGWLPNHRVPHAFAQARVTVHVPRRPYTLALRGVPTIGPFEALACGIPLVSAPWEDSEHLFTPGRDYLLARNGREMEEHLGLLLHDERARQELIAQGLRTLQARHTCAHRVDELLAICRELGVATGLGGFPGSLSEARASA